MDINPVLIVSLESYCTELKKAISEKISHIFPDAEDKNKLEELVKTVRLNEEGLQVEQGNRLPFDLNSSVADKAVDTIYNAFNEKVGDIQDVLGGVLGKLLRQELDAQIRDQTGLEVSKRVQVFVALPLYTPLSSAFLTFLFANWRTLFDYSGYDLNVYFVGLCPDLEYTDPDNFGKAEKEWAFARTYATLSECEAKVVGNYLMSEVYFFLLSDFTNDSSHVGGNAYAKQLLSEVFFQHYLNRVNLNQNLLNPADQIFKNADLDQPKYGFYSSIGACQYVYPKDHITHQLERIGRYELLKHFREKLSNNKQDVNQINNEVTRKINDRQWYSYQALLDNLTDLDFKQYFKRTAVAAASEVVDPENLLQRINDQKNLFFNEYFEGTFQRSVSEKVTSELNETKAQFNEFLHQELQKADSLILSRVIAYFSLLIGKSNDEFLTGRIDGNQQNLALLEEQVKEEYKQYLPDDERVDKNELNRNENRLNQLKIDKQDLAQDINKLQKRVYDLKDLHVDLEEENEAEEQYFLLNGDKKVKINGNKPEHDPLPEVMTEFEPQVETDQLPGIVDLREFLTPVKDQSQIGSCTANAVVGAYEYLVKRTTERADNLSRLFVYYNGRLQDGKLKDGRPDGSGSSINGCLAAITEFGVCSEQTWPYTDGNIDAEPDHEAYEEARDNKASEGIYIPLEPNGLNLDRMKQCLAEGYPFVFGLKLFNSFQRIGRTGIVPDPRQQQEDSFGEGTHGNHAMLCVGYSEADKLFIVRNSWGAEWGDNGCCYISFDHLADPNMHSNSHVYGLTRVLQRETEFATEQTFAEGSSLLSLSDEKTDLERRKERYAEVDQNLNDLQEAISEQRDKLEREDQRIDQRFKEACKSDELGDNQKRKDEAKETLRSKFETSREAQESLDNELEDAKKKQQWAFIAVPALVLLLCGVFVFLDLRFGFGIGLIDYLGGTFLIAAGYGSWSVYHYFYSVKPPVSRAREERDRANNALNSTYNNYLELHNQDFQIEKKHYQLRMYQNLIRDIQDFVKDSILYNLNWWIRQVDRHIEDDTAIDDLKGDFNLEYCLQSSDIQELLKQSELYSNFFRQGTHPIHPYFTNLNNEQVDYETGFNTFLSAILDHLKGLRDFYQLDKLTAFDFLFGTHQLPLPYRDTNSRRQKMVALLKRSAPLMHLDDQYGGGGEPSYQYLLVTAEEGNKENIRWLENVITDEFGANGNNLQLVNSNDPNKIQIIRVLSGFPAYQSTVIRKCLSDFMSLESDKEKLWADKPEEDRKLIPG